MYLAPARIQTFAPQLTTRVWKCQSSVSLNMVYCYSVTAILGYVLWRQHQERLKKLWEAAKKAARIPRKWKAKSPDDCPACTSGVSLTVQAIHRDVPAWPTGKQSTRGRKKLIKTQGHACLNPDCLYFGVTDERVHALVGNGKRGKYGHIQTFRCQACQRSFSSRRNTPLYHLKTHPGRVEMCLWLLAEGVDIAVRSLHGTCRCYPVSLADARRGSQ